LPRLITVVDSWGLMVRFGRNDRIGNFAPDSNSDPAETVRQLYNVERQAGFSILTNTVVLWIAATTYFTAAFGLLALLHLWDTPGDQGASHGIGMTTSQAIPHILFYWLPFPAWAIAGYHVIFFDMQAAHSRSISILERNLMSNYVASNIQKLWGEGQIGSKAETDRTEWGFQLRKIPVVATGIVSLIVPYVSAILLTYVCFTNLHEVIQFPDRMYWIAIGLYTAFGVSIIGLGLQSGWFLLGKPRHE